MNKKWYSPILTTFILLFSINIYSQKFEIEITNIEPQQGEVKVAIFDNENDWLEEPVQALSFKADAESKKVSFDLPHGTYGISVYQDLNGNDELDTNFLGIPKEPIAFGNNYKPLGKPNFKSAAVKFKSGYEIPQLKLYTIL